MLPAILAALAPILLPEVAKLALGDSPVAAKVGEAAIAVTSAVTGQPIATPEDAAAAVRAVQADPDLLAELHRQQAERTISVMVEETKRLGIVNETMRAETASSDAYVRRMRPTFGYVMALAWLVTFAAIGWVTVTQPDKAPAVLTALSDTWWLWTVGLSVLGLYVAGRTSEKGAAGNLLDMLPLPGRKAAR